MEAEMNNYGLLALMQALDSLFPIGAFTLSGGLETYTQNELIRDRNSLENFLSVYLHTLITNDLGFAAKAAQGVNTGYLDEICTAAKSPYELRNGSERLCTRFLKAELALGFYPLLCRYSEEIAKDKCRGHYCIALGLFISDVRVDIETGLQMYCYSLLSAAVNHAVKLVPLRQLDGQAALGESMKHIPETVGKAVSVMPDELGINGFGLDFRSMQHEKLYSRIYIS